MKPFLSFTILLFQFYQATAHPPISIAMDSQGAVYYSDLVHVWKITPDGSHTIAVKDVHTHELYLDAEDNLYGEHIWYEGEATDKWGHYVWCLKKNGTIEHIIPRTEGFPSNNKLVRDRDGNEYWSEKSDSFEVLQRQSPKGNISLYVAHKFQDIRWICPSKNNGEIYIIDHLTLKKITEDQRVITITNLLKEKAPPFFSANDRHYLMGVWTDMEANVYVAVYGAQKIKKITPDGKIETILKSPKNWSPSGGLFAPDGSLWVLEYSNRNKARVRKISPEGKIEIFEK